MHYLFYIYLMLFCSILLRLLGGNFGITAPFPAAVIFGLAVIYGWRIGILVAVIVGVIIELLYGDSTLTPLMLIFVVATAQLWVHYYDTKNFLALMVPGAIIGLILFMPRFFFSNNSWYTLYYLIPELLFSIIMMTCIVPLTIYMMDKLAVVVGLPLFKDAKIKLIHQKR